MSAPEERGSSAGWKLWLGLPTLVLAALVLFFLIGPDAADILRAYPSPEVHRNVYEVSVPAGLVVPVRETEGDFDGDGTLDVLEVEYFYMEPLHRPTTAGMVYVRCGRSGEVLLAHAVGSPMTNAAWTGDVDGNRTDDVAINDREENTRLDRWIVLGRERP